MPAGLSAAAALRRPPARPHRRSEAVTAQAGHVQQHVGHAVVGNDEAKSLGDVEPFDDARQLDEIGRRLVGEFSDRSWSEIGCLAFLIQSRPTP